MLRRFLFTLTLAMLVHTAAAGLPEIKAAAENCVTTVERLQKEAPNAQTPAQTAELVNALAACLEQFATATEVTKKDNPQLLTQAEPPPEMVEVFQRWAQVSSNLGAISQHLNKALEAHSQDPAVNKAMQTLSAAMMHVNTVMQ